MLVVGCAALTHPTTPSRLSTTAPTRPILIRRPLRKYALLQDLRRNEHGRPADAETQAQAEAIPQGVRRLFPAEGHRRSSAGVHLRAALGHPREECRADRDQRWCAAKDVAGVPQPAQVG